MKMKFPIHKMCNWIVPDFVEQFQFKFRPPIQLFSLCAFHFLILKRSSTIIQSKLNFIDKVDPDMKKEESIKSAKKKKLEIIFEFFFFVEPLLNLYVRYD